MPRRDPKTGRFLPKRKGKFLKKRKTTRKKTTRWKALTAKDKRLVADLFGYSDTVFGDWPKAKTHKKKPPKKNVKGRVTGTSKKKPQTALWMYFKGNVDVGHLFRGAEWFGDGCCTDGYADVSYFFKDSKEAARVAKTLVKKPGVGWVETYLDTPTTGFGVNKTRNKRYYLAKNLPAKIKNKIEKRAKFRFGRF